MRGSGHVGFSPAAVVLAAAAVYALGAAVVWPHARGGFWTSTILETFGPAVAGALAMYRARKLSGRARQSWLLLGAGPCAYSAGMLVYSWHEVVVHDPAPFPGLPDVGFLLAPALIAAGIVRYPRASRGTWSLAQDGSASLLIALCTLLVGWVAAIGTAYSVHAVSWPTRIVGMAYPCGDVLVISMLLMLVRRSSRHDRAPLAFLAIGMLMLGVADSAYVLMSSAGTYYTGVWVDPGWWAGFSMVGVAAYAYRPHAIEAAGRDTVPGVSSLVLPTAVALAGLSAIAYHVLSGNTPSPFEIGLVMSVMLLLLARQVILLMQVKEVARDLESAGRRASASFEGATIGLMLLDADGVVLAVNRSCAAMLGRSQSSLVGMRGVDLVHPDDRGALVESRDLRLGHDAGQVVLELRCPRPDGTLVDTRCTVSTVREEDGSLLHQLAEIEDVTELRRLEAALAEARALEEAVVELSDDVLSIVEPDGTIRLVSPSVEAALGYAPDELLGRNFIEYVHPADRADAQQAVLAALRGEGPATVRCHVATKAGSIRIWDAAIAAERCTDRLPEFLVANLRDVTDHVAREEAHRLEMEAANRALSSHVDRLKKADELKDELMSVVSHDLRTPLTSIVGYLELLRQDLDQLNPEQSSFFEAIERNAERLQALVEHLLLISRAESGRLTVNAATVDLRTLAEQCLETIRPGAQAKNLALRLEGSGPFELHGDPNLLAQMLDNLVSNAVKFTERGQVTVGLEHGEHGRVLLSVADTGPGIAAEDRDSIFDRFFRAPSMEAVPGTGLGLSIVQAIVTGHGGTIGVQSEPGHGTTFLVELPAAGAGVERERAAFVAAA